MNKTCRHALVALMAATVAGCAIETVEIRNRQAAQELERESRPPGSVYLGWRVFQDRCARCHGDTAEGTGHAPDLLPILRTMGARQFVDTVLRRYDWNAPAAQRGDGAGARTVSLEDALERREPPLAMPQWQGEPRVNAHLVDLYAYLSARAQGTQGPQRPER
jgi:hypothetical protein